MQRSVFLYSGSVVKNNCVVELSEFLDLTGVTVCGSGQGEEECYFGRELGEAHGWTGSLSVSQDDKKVAPITAPDDAPEEKETRTNTKARGMYVMVAVVVHYGTHESGHFVTYRRIRSGQWVCVSDESVQVVTQKNVFEMASRYAYLVFYERVCDKNQ